MRNAARLTGRIHALVRVNAVLLLALALNWNVGAPVMAKDLAQTEELPVIPLDAVDPARWSDSSLAAAPGQTIRITNRGVLPHTFVVSDWGVRVDLPTLEPVAVVVPESAEIGRTYNFLCDEPGHADDGMAGTILIVSADDARSGIEPGTDGTANPTAITLVANDTLSWSPGVLEVGPGQIMQVRNPGVIEHHFVVDEWGINETISAGETALVRVPSDAVIGSMFAFYCSVPGHRAAGMEGTITIIDTGPPPSSSGGPGSTAAIVDVDIRQFVPSAGMLGEGWSEVRSGNVRSIVPEWGEINVSVFPGDGIGIVFVGPAGSRAAVAVLPLETTTLPTNQVQQAIDDVQFALMQNWNTNSSSSVNLDGIAPPPGCDIAQRATGVAGLHTLPAGLTVCQVRNANVAIFVTIEGELGELSGIEASDHIITVVLERFGNSASQTRDGLILFDTTFSSLHKLDWFTRP